MEQPCPMRGFEGAKKLKEALPGLDINLGWETAAPAAAAK